MNDLRYPPIVGDWYRNPEGDIFEVVALDEDDGTIEIQHFDGSLEELDVDVWEEQFMDPIEPPEDWSGSLDIEREDYGVDLGEPAGGLTYQAIEPYLE